MLERATTWRRKVVKALKGQLGLSESPSLRRKSSSRSAGSSSHKSRSDIDSDEVGGQYARSLSVGSSDGEFSVRSPSSAEGQAERPLDIDLLREMTVKGPRGLTITVPPRPRTPDSIDGPELLNARPSSSSSSPGANSPSGSSSPTEGSAPKRTFQRVRSMPLSVNDPMRKLRDSYIRMMHKMAEDDAKANPLSPSSPLVVSSDVSPP